MTGSITVNSPLRLNEKVKLKNRIAKAAMSERLGSSNCRATSKLATLYKNWVDGNVGLLVTGNIMIDRRALGEPNNVVVENDEDIGILKQWASAAQNNQTLCLAQINHPGRQAPKGLNRETVAPSQVAFNEPMRSMFGTPRELSISEIQGIVERFGETAAICEQAGFSGVQIHGAHGYLVSQFLSPLTNLRGDNYGGSAERRRKFMLDAYDEIRRRTSKDFLVSIKINSADFQRGGFSEEESLTAIKSIADAGIDLLEISGGSYEEPSMTGKGVKSSTVKREAYFLEFAKKVRKLTTVPLMVTGGFRTREAMDAALAAGHLDLIGMARPLAIDPGYAKMILDNQTPRHLVKPVKTGIKSVDKTGMLEVSWYTEQLRRMGNGMPAKPNASALLFFLNMMRKHISLRKRKSPRKLRA